MLKQKKGILQICEKYQNIFHLPDEKLTANNFYTQDITCIENSPVYIKNYRIPNSQKEELNKQVNDLLVDDIIEPSTSPYNSPLLIVPKKK